MRRMFALVMVVTILGLTACKDIFAPEHDEKEILLPPFPFQSWTTTVGAANSQSVNFYVPVGAAPQLFYKVDELSGNPNIEVEVNAVPVTGETCSGTCQGAVWTLIVSFTANSTGEARISIFDKSNLEKPSSFKVIVTN